MGKKLEVAEAGVVDWNMGGRIGVAAASIDRGGSSKDRLAFEVGGGSDVKVS